MVVRPCQAPLPRPIGACDTPGRCSQWVLCFLTQHHSKLRRIDKALAHIEEVISLLARARGTVSHRADGRRRSSTRLQSWSSTW